MHYFRSLLLALFTASALLTIAPIASAGDCPSCNSAADCDRPNSFCVRWNRENGCGTLRQMCCPGQNCNTFSGRPSCEATGACTVVGSSPVADAQVPTDAIATSDSSVATDSAVSRDAGSVTDAIVSPVDAASVADVLESPDAAVVRDTPARCGCTVPGGNGHAPGNRTLALALVAVALGVTRRRNT